jgi:hypothetical protein
MTRAKSTEEQLIGVLREHDAGATQAEEASGGKDAGCGRARDDRLRRSHVASPAPDGVKSAEILIATG